MSWGFSCPYVCAFWACVGWVGKQSVKWERWEGWVDEELVGLVEMELQELLSFYKCVLPGSVCGGKGME